jgi:hypothetical protein
LRFFLTSGTLQEGKTIDNITNKKIPTILFEGFLP